MPVRRHPIVHHVVDLGLPAAPGSAQGSQHIRIEANGGLYFPRIF